MTCDDRRQYGCLAFLLDVLLVLITQGLWIIWIFVREMRRRRRPVACQHVHHW